MNGKYIGIFDSGLGGMTLVSYLNEIYPGESIVFLADTANMPYGEKSSEEILSFSRKNISFLRKKELKAVIIACNTSDSISSDTLMKENDIPVLGVIEAAARKAVCLSRSRKIAVLATPLTASSGAYEKKIGMIDPDVEVTAIGCSGLAPMIEAGAFADDPEALKRCLEGYVAPLRGKDIDTLILGCTHYDVLIGMTRELLNGINVVSSSRCIVDELHDHINMEGGDSDTEKLFYVTGDPEQFRRTASLLINDLSIEKAIL